jgi:malate synthase
MRVDAGLKSFVEDKVLPGTGIGAGRFWDGLRSILEDLAPRNRALLQRRDALQAEVDAWHKAHPGVAGAEYTAMLRDCGYLAPDPPPFQVATENVDPEIARVAGPQLVCPVDNARFIVNAANARWGSLLDAIYGTDVLEGDRSGPYNKQRGAAAFEKVRIGGESKNGRGQNVEQRGAAAFEKVRKVDPHIPPRPRLGLWTCSIHVHPSDAKARSLLD